MLRRDLAVDVVLEAGPYGSFEVLVDGERVVDGGRLAFLGVLPSVHDIAASVKRRIAQPRNSP